MSDPPAIPPSDDRSDSRQSRRTVAGDKGALAGQSASDEPRPKTFAFSSLLPWAAAACLAATAAVFGQRYLSSQSETELLHEQIATVEVVLKSVQNENDAAQIIARRQVDILIQQAAATARQLDAAQDRIAALQHDLQAQGDLANFQITTLASASKDFPQAFAVAVWNPAKQEGVLRVEQLPAPAADQDYQLWLVDPQYPNPVDGGVFTVGAQTGTARVKFTGRQPVAAISAFAVTLERKGGVPKAEGPFVLLGK
jgi:hypothetical protein